MGRSSKEEATRTRARIVKTACDLFRVSGVDKVSVADVMHASGLTTGGFYKHFASKEALAAEAIGLAFAQSSLAWNAAASAGCTCEEPLSRRARIVEFYLRPNPPKRCPMIAFAASVTTADTGETPQNVYRRGIKALLENFIGLRKAGSVNSSPATAERNAMLIFAAMIGARMLNEAAGAEAWSAQVYDAVLDAAAAAA